MPTSSQPRLSLSRRLAMLEVEPREKSLTPVSGCCKMPTLTSVRLTPHKDIHAQSESNIWRLPRHLGTPRHSQQSLHSVRSEEEEGRRGGHLPPLICQSRPLNISNNMQNEDPASEEKQDVKRKISRQNSLHKTSSKALRKISSRTLQQSQSKTSQASKLKAPQSRERKISAEFNLPDEDGVQRAHLDHGKSLEIKRSLLHQPPSPHSATMSREDHAEALESQAATSKKPGHQSHKSPKKKDEKGPTAKGGGHGSAAASHQYYSVRGPSGGGEKGKKRRPSKEKEKSFSGSVSDEEIDLLRVISTEKQREDDSPEGSIDTESKPLKAQGSDVDKPGSEGAAKPAAKKPANIKDMYKQLLSLTLSSGIFRSMVVTTKDGEHRPATDEQTLQVVESMADQAAASIMDENEEMALIMGSSSAPRHSIRVIETQPDLLSKSGLALLDNRPMDFIHGKPKKQDEAALFKEVLTTSTTPHHATPGKHKKEKKDKEKASEAPPGIHVDGETTPPDAKKKILKLPPIRLRRTMPPQNPFLLCIRTPAIDLNHDQVKNMLEAQAGTLDTLQHDPEYLQNGAIKLPSKVMWIFSMEDKSENNYLKICMDGILDHDGELLRVRKRDDVYLEEYRALLLVEQIKEEQRKMIKSKQKQKKQRNK